MFKLASVLVITLLFSAASAAPIPEDNKLLNAIEAGLGGVTAGLLGTIQNIGYPSKEGTVIESVVSSYEAGANVGSALGHLLLGH